MSNEQPMPESFDLAKDFDFEETFKVFMEKCNLGKREDLLVDGERGARAFKKTDNGLDFFCPSCKQWIPAIGNMASCKEELSKHIKTQHPLLR